MKPISLFSLLIGCLLSTAILGQHKAPHTLSYDETTGSPNANLNVIDWIEGHWRGEAFGGTTEEVWTPPLGGSMMCVFKHVVQDKVTFYEIVTIIEENSTLILKLKHFDGALKGWEEKDETVDFKLVKVTDDIVYFDDFTFERVSNDEINIYVLIDEGSGEQEVTFNYHRVKK